MTIAPSDILSSFKDFELIDFVTSLNDIIDGIKYDDNSPDTKITPNYTIKHLKAMISFEGDIFIVRDIALKMLLTHVTTITDQDRNPPSFEQVGECMSELIELANAITAEYMFIRSILHPDDSILGINAVH